MYENDIEHLRKIIASLRALPDDSMISAGALSNVLDSLCAVLSALCDEQDNSCGEEDC